MLCAKSRFLPSTALFVLVVASLMTSIAMAPVVAQTTSIIKSESDPREYRALVLDNGMKVVLVSDPATDKAAASLSVEIGSGSNPQDRAGLAHFLEHMLFLGTDKYPQAGEYKDFISRHGGGDNAYTAFNETNYFFNVDAGFLEPTLDRFAQFFIAPRFNPEYVDREREVVHSEYLGRRTNDARRGYAAAQQVMNPAHPSSGFAVGNLQTLADRPGSSIRDELIAFYNRYYSANLMALAVVGREPLDVLEQWVRSRFSVVRNTDAKGLKTDVPLYLPGTLPARLDVVPERESFSVSFSFPMRSVREFWRQKPASHVAHLLGHEGDTSLLAELKRRGWAQALSAGADDHISGGTFDVNIQLTPEGAGHVDEIAKLLFDTVAIIKRDGVQRWLFDENAKLAQINFQFPEKPSPGALARRLASMQHEIPQDQLLRAPYAFDEWRPDLIREVLDALRPDNVLVTRVAPGLQTDKTAPWYDTPYRVTSLDASTVAAWTAGSADKTQANLAIPPRNPFIPARLDIRTGDVTETPKLIENKPGFQLWHAQQDQFKLPKADVFVSIRSPLANNTPSHALLTSLYVSLVNDQLDAFAYAADLAGLSFSLYPHSRGLSLRISGYDDRQPLLLERILKVLASGKVDAQRFAIFKAAAKRNLENARRDQPYRRAMSRLRDLIVYPNWTREERLAVIDALSAQQLERFVPRLLSTVKVIALTHGNVDRAGAEAMGALVHSALVAPAQATEVTRGKVVALNRRDRLTSDIMAEHPESALVKYAQAHEHSLRSRALSGLISQILSSPFFDVLRTEKKLGYVVFANAYPVLDTAGLVFIVQSPVANASSLQNEVVSFLRTYEQQLATMSSTEFEQHKAALIAQITEKERQLSERSDRFWTELDRENFNFDTRDKLAATVGELSLEETRRFYHDVLVSPDSRLATMRVHGQSTPPATESTNTSEQAATAAWTREHRNFLD